MQKRGSELLRPAPCHPCQLQVALGELDDALLDGADVPEAGALFRVAVEKRPAGGTGPNPVAGGGAMPGPQGELEGEPEEGEADAVDAGLPEVIE